MKSSSSSSRRLHPTLPVFAVEGSGASFAYVPGFVLLAGPARLARIERELEAPAGPREAASVALERCVREVEARWRALADAPFEPRCLSLHLPYACQLTCAYCFARPSGTDASGGGAAADTFVCDWNEPALRAAAAEVAAACARAGEPFTLVIQGAGEPTLFWRRIRDVVRLTRRMASAHGIGWTGHLTTNGQGSPRQIEWLAEQFDSVTLSCDGPPERQDRLRPRRDGGPSSAAVQRSARILSRRARRFAVRATVAPEDSEALGDLVDYVACVLGSSRLRIELTFRRAAGGMDEALASRFVAAYLAAETRARDLGLRLDYSGVRLDELHGPYCDGARGVLRIAPGGARLPCFLGDLPGDGAPPPITAGEALRVPLRCRDCFNRYHCARSCPDECPSDGRWSPAAETRCLIQRELARHWLSQAGRQPLPNPARTPALDPKPDSHDRFEGILGDLPEGIRGDLIREEWERASRTLDIEAREMPAAPWSESGFDIDGEAGWERLCQMAARELSPVVAVYVHIPFCAQSCHFCDCHTVPVRRPDGVAYAAQLRDHLRAWRRATPLADREISTVHFGGGTPLALGPRLDEIVAELRESLHCGPETEFALETTASLCGERELARLRSLGFTRLHLGVQTLDGSRQRLLGRRHDGAGALDRVRLALNAGFVTSVDILYGLPGQSLGQITETVRRLAGAGIHGLSAYRLNRSVRNEVFFRAHPGFRPDALADYAALHCIEQILTGAGYRKNHFVHYARGPDDNRYFRHRARGEDLAALGASASGSIGELSYRFRPWPAFATAGAAPGQALEGVCHPPAGNDPHAARLQALCLAAEIEPAAFAAAGCARLLTEWTAAGLVRPDSASGDWVLTASGSWAMRDLIQAIRALGMRKSASPTA